MNNVISDIDLSILKKYESTFPTNFINSIKKGCTWLVVQGKLTYQSFLVVRNSEDVFNKKEQDDTIKIGLINKDKPTEGLSLYSILSVSESKDLSSGQTVFKITTNYLNSNKLSVTIIPFLYYDANENADTYNSNEIDDMINSIKKELSNLDAIKSLTDEQLAAINSTATKDKIDSIELKANKEDVYTKTETYSKTEINDKLKNVDVDINTDNLYTKSDIDKKLLTKANSSDVYDKTTINAMLDKRIPTDYYSQAVVNSKLLTKVDTSTLTKDYYNKTTTDSLLNKKVSTTDLEKNYYNKEDTQALILEDLNINTYSKSEINQKLVTKVDQTVLKSDYTNNTDLATKLNTKVDKTTLESNYYNKKDTETKVNALITDATYSKAEINQKLVNKIELSTLEANYTNNAGLKKLLASKVNTDDFEAAIKQRQEEQEVLKASVLETSTNLQGQITTMQTKLTEASTEMETSLTAMQNSLTTTANNINSRYDELVSNVNDVKTSLVAKDQSLQDQITEIDLLVPNTASETNQLADKEYVKDLVVSNAARGITYNANGDSYPDKATLDSGPWYYQGEELDNPHNNDYAIVTADALNDGNDVRYNYDGKGWIRFQVYKSGQGFNPTTTQLAAINSGITTTKVNLIDTINTNLTKEISDRKSEDKTLLARIATEEGTRETAVNNLTSAISAEQLARTNADNQTLAKIESEAATRQADDNTIKALITTNRTEVDTTIGSLATLGTHVKTSIVNAINNLHDEVHSDRVAKAGDTMTGKLNIELSGSGDVLGLKAADKEVKFTMDADIGAMNIVPTSAPTTGFQISALSINPRDGNAEYSLGSSTLPWDNAWIDNINGTAVSSLITAVSDLSTLTEKVTKNTTDIEDRVKKTGDTMSGKLAIALTGSGNLLEFTAGDKGVNFVMDSDAGAMSIVPASAPSLGFEVSAFNINPRSSTGDYSLGSKTATWDNAWIDNINDTPVTSLINAVSDLATLTTQVNENTANLDKKLDLTGGELSGTLKVVLPGSGDVFHIEAAQKGLTFSIDADSGYLHLIPVSDRSLGFEFSATTFIPRTNTMSSSLGSQTNTWTNVYADNLTATNATITSINGVAASNYAKTTDIDNLSDVLTKKIDSIDVSSQLTNTAKTNEANTFTKDNVFQGSVALTAGTISAAPNSDSDLVNYKALTEAVANVKTNPLTPYVEITRAEYDALIEKKTGVYYFVQEA